MLKRRPAGIGSDEQSVPHLIRLPLEMLRCATAAATYICQYATTLALICTLWTPQTTRVASLDAESKASTKYARPVAPPRGDQIVTGQ